MLLKQNILKTIRVAEWMYEVDALNFTSPEVVLGDKRLPNHIRYASHTLKGEKINDVMVALKLAQFKDIEIEFL